MRRRGMGPEAIEAAREFFTYVPACKIWICTNHRPRVHDDTWSFWRRVRLIPFEVTFDADRADPHLVDCLKTQAEGILAWAVRGCLEWQREGLQSPEAVKTATEEYEPEAAPCPSSSPSAASSTPTPRSAPPTSTPPTATGPPKTA